MNIEHGVNEMEELVNYTAVEETPVAGGEETEVSSEN